MTHHNPKALREPAARIFKNMNLIILWFSFHLCIQGLVGQSNLNPFLNPIFVRNMGIYCNCPPSTKGKQMPAFEQLAQGHTGSKSEIRNWDLDPSDILSFLQHSPCSLWGLETLLELGNHKSCYRTLETPHRIETPRRNVWSYWCCCADINHNRAIQKHITQPWAPLPLEFLTKGTRGAFRMYLETAA